MGVPRINRGLAGFRLCTDRDRGLRRDSPSLGILRDGIQPGSTAHYFLHSTHQNQTASDLGTTRLFGRPRDNRSTTRHANTNEFDA